MKDISKGTADFEKIRKDGALYVDKTAYFWPLIRDFANSQYFLSRPRRFGKSLTLSTLKAIFQGKKELFDGLAISNHDYSWEKYPIIHLDFCDYENDGATAQSVKEYLINSVRQIAVAYGITLECDLPTCGALFAELIQKMSAEKQVVILIDEYDKAITENLGHKDILEIRDVLAGFYSVLKKNESHIRFLFMTGVTKFSQVSIFSKLNNLTDLSMHRDFATMLGYTQDELEKYFADYIQLAAKENCTSLEETRENIKFWYNGFRFHQSGQTVYNPVSIAMFFTNNFEYLNYWFRTATPTMLFQLAVKRHVDLVDAIKTTVKQRFFDSFEVEDPDPIVLLQQTGYLTIASTTGSGMSLRFKLDFPNNEVRSSFYEYLLDFYTASPKSVTDGYMEKMERAVAGGNVDGIVKLINVHFANVPNRIKLNDEKYYQTIFVSLFMVLGYDIVAESSTYDGYIDAVMVNGDWCFIFEFKLDKSASVAMDQIKEKEYYRKYLGSPQKIMLIGATFDSEKGLLTNIQTELVEK